MIINTRWWACILSTYDDVLPGKEEENKYENYGNFKLRVGSSPTVCATYENLCVTHTTGNFVEHYSEIHDSDIESINVHKGALLCGPVAMG